MARGWGAQGEIKPKKQKTTWGAQTRKQKLSKTTPDEDDNHEENDGTMKYGPLGRRRRG